MVNVVPYEKIECHHSPEEGVIACDEIGTCNLNFPIFYLFLSFFNPRYLLNVSRCCGV